MEGEQPGEVGGWRDEKKKEEEGDVKYSRASRRTGSRRRGRVARD